MHHFSELLKKTKWRRSKGGKNRAEKRNRGVWKEKSKRKAASFDRDKESEKEIGELEGDMRKHSLMRKKKWGLKMEPAAAIWF